MPYFDPSSAAYRRACVDWAIRHGGKLPKVTAKPAKPPTPPRVRAKPQTDCCPTCQCDGLTIELVKRDCGLWCKVCGRFWKERNGRVAGLSGY